MTKLNIYCLFDKKQALYGVYSSIKSVHKDALKLCNDGHRGVFIRYEEQSIKPDIKLLRNIFKGEFDIKVDYYSDNSKVTILKTNIKD
jgi:hypothetical protein